MVTAENDAVRFIIPFLSDDKKIQIIKRISH